MSEAWAAERDPRLAAPCPDGLSRRVCVARRRDWAVWTQWTNVADPALSRSRSTLHVVAACAMRAIVGVNPFVNPSGRYHADALDRADVVDAPTRENSTPRTWWTLVVRLMIPRSKVRSHPGPQHVCCQRSQRAARARGRSGVVPVRSHGRPLSARARERLACPFAVSGCVALEQAMGEFETGAGEKERHRHLRAHLLRRLALVDDDAGIAITDVILTEILQGLRSQRDVRRRGTSAGVLRKPASQRPRRLPRARRRCIRRALIDATEVEVRNSRGAKATPVVQRIGETDPTKIPRRRGIPWFVTVNPGHRKPALTSTSCKTGTP